MWFARLGELWSVCRGEHRKGAPVNIQKRRVWKYACAYKPLNLYDGRMHKAMCLDDGIKIHETKE
jgi:hypothetical protein